MIRCRSVLVAVALVAVGSGCGVGVDAEPRPLEPISVGPLQPAPTVVERPDDRSAVCLPRSRPPTPTPTPTPSAEERPSTAPPTTEAC